MEDFQVPPLTEAMPTTSDRKVGIPWTGETSSIQSGWWLGHPSEKYERQLG